MSITIRIPTPLRKLTGDAEEVRIDAVTLRDMITTLERQYPGIKDRLCDESGEVRRFINVFVNDEDVRFMEGQATQLKDGDVVSIVTASASLSLCVAPAPAVSSTVCAPSVSVNSAV